MSVLVSFGALEVKESGPEAGGLKQTLERWSRPRNQPHGSPNANPLRMAGLVCSPPDELGSHYPATTSQLRGEAARTSTSQRS